MHTLDRDRIQTLLGRAPSADAVDVYGWIRTKRDTKTVCFLEVNDGSCMRNLQAIINKENTDLQEVIDSLHTGCSVRLSGTLVTSPGSGQAVELSCTAAELIGSADPQEFPLQKKRHSFEYLRQIAHLRPRTNTFGAVARVRSRLSLAVHTFFQENGFFYVHAPIITASDAEGAGEMFRVTTLGANAPADAVDFFGRAAYLTVSGQLSAECYATALDRVYTFGPTFRAENSNTSRHLAEFWMIEPETAFCDLSGNMELAERFLKYLIRDLLAHCGEDMAFFDQRIHPGLVESLQAVAEAPFAQMSYTTAIEALQRSGHSFEYKPEWGIDIQTEHEKFLTEQIVRGPVIVTDYPRDIKAFYMKQNPDGRTVRGMDVLVPRLGEIIGGSQREDNLEALERRMRELGMELEPYWWYLDLRRFGSVPHSGFGLGFERLIQYVTGMQNIRDVIPFPRAAGSADF